jgi:hypothetical protein
LGIESTTEPGKRIRSMGIVAIILFIVSVFLWWANTVAAMLFLFAAMFVIVYTFCAIPISQPPPVVRRRRWDGMTIERIDLLERRMRESLEEIVTMEEEEEKDTSYAIPVDDVESESSGLVHDIPVEVIDGIGKTYGMKLQNIGVEKLEDLALSSHDRVAEVCNIDSNEAAGWIADAIGICHGAGMTSVLELALSDAEELLDRIELAFEEGLISIPKDHEFTIWKTRHWITAANEHIILSPEDIRRWAEDNR